MWSVTIVVLVTCTMSLSFVLLQFKSMGEVRKIAREERERIGRHITRAEQVRLALVLLAGYLGVAIVFLAGWRVDRLEGGVVAVVGIALIGALIAVVAAIRAALAKKA